VAATQNAKLMFSLSESLKDALGEYAAEHELSDAAVIRQAIAQYIGFDLSTVEKQPRSGRMYASVEERREAQKERNKEKRALVRELLSLAKSGERDKAIAALEASVARMSVRPLIADEPEAEIEEEDEFEGEPDDEG
jgi:predicted transcriptional regulator